MFRTRTLLWIPVLLLCWLTDVAAAAPPAQQALGLPPPAPAGLEQRDAYGELPLGELLGDPAVTFRFLVAGQPGEMLTPEVELRPLGEHFVGANLLGHPLTASGAQEVVEITTTQRLLYRGYHWRARVVGQAGASEWAAFGANADAVSVPYTFADADFYNLYEPLTPGGAPPVGFEALVRVSRLPLITQGVATRQVSSFDRTEGNQDGGSGEYGLETFFYRQGDAEVVLEVDGPGQITRIWFAESGDPGFLNTRLQFFFDGATDVSYEIPVVDMMRGDVPPLVFPLVLNPDRSSGGNVSYVPIPFREGIKVRLVGAHAHYQITYQVFSSAEGVQTFTGHEDYTLARHLWQRLGQDPKPTRGNQTVGSSGAIEPGASVLLADLHGQGVLQSLQIRLPQLATSILGTPPLDDTVRAHRLGESRFHLTPAQPGAPARLRLRRGCRYAPQVADVFLDGNLAGAWTRTYADDSYRWCEDTFVLPAAAEPASPTLNLRIASQHPDNAWEEARYWLEQEIDGHWQVVDELDVGDESSELAHNYSIVGETWSGVRTGTYRPQVWDQPPSEMLLEGLRLRVTADDAPQPDVDVPVGAFFGSAIGEANVASLLAGIITEDHLFYSYWPMPYASGLRIELYNASPIRVESFSAEAAYAPRLYPSPGELTGYFRVFESLSRPTVLDVDHPLIHVRGAGHLVGLHLLIHSGDAGFLEGDERFHVDGALTPQVRGTGTEDVFNCGWYYNRGRVLHALHGVNSTRAEWGFDQYRWYLSDYIPFADQLSGGIEHAATNDANADYSSWAYTYLAPRAALLLEDSVDLSDAVSMQEHNVKISGTATLYTLAGQFEGDDDTEITDGGYRLEANAALVATLAVDPHAGQVLLRRRYDQGQDKERLRVWVNGELAGEWLDGGRNIARRWRESEFLLPPTLTPGQDRLTIRLEPLPWGDSQGANLARLTALSLHRQPHTSWIPLVLAHR